ncbi:MAG: hypothetical protein ACLPND_11710 [Candidatus Korobacteraceae bacterium]
MSTEWIEQQNAANQRATAEAEASSRRALDASARIANRSGDVFQRFVSELKLNTDALPKLVGEELSGSTSPIGATSCQVNVTWHNIRYGPNILSWNYHFSPDGIRFVIFGQPERIFPFRLNRKGEVGIGYGDDIVTPEKMAELTIKKMRELARKVSGSYV